MITFNTEQVTKNTTSKDLEALNAGCPEVKLQEKSVEYTQNAEYVVSPDAGYDGLSKVNVSVDLVVPTVQNSKTVNITKNGSTTVKPDTGYDVVEQVVVNTNIPLQEKQVDVLLSEPTTVITPDTGYEGITKLTVTHSPVEANTAYTATNNGNYTITPSEGYDATTSVNLTVNVPATPVEPTKQVTITSNGTTNIIPAAGYDAIEGVDVTVNVPSKEEETKSVSYTSNGSYTVQPTEGKTLSEVSVSVNVTNPPTAYDINNPNVRLGGTYFDSGVVGVNFLSVKQSDIDALTGWESLTDGSGKCVQTFPTEDIIFNLPEITSANLMFYGGQYLPPSVAREHKISFTSGSLSKLKFAQKFAGFNQLWFDFSNVDLSNCDRIEFGKATIQTDNYLKLGVNQMEETSCAFVNNEVKFQFVRKFDLGRSNTLNFKNNTNLHKAYLIFNYPFNPDLMFYGCSRLTDVDIQGNIYPADSSIYAANFYGCSRLQNLSITTISKSMHLEEATSLTQESVNNIINALADGVTNQTITFAATQYGYITEEQKTAATAKGWTINQA